MAYNRIQARNLCTASEYTLFEASLADHIKSLQPAALRGAIRRARVARDKYRDLLQRQRLATRARTGSKKGGSPDVNARTGQKAQLFDEVLQRLQNRQDELTRQAERAARKQARDEARAQAQAAQAKRAAARAKLRKKAVSTGKRAATAAAPDRAGFVAPGAGGAARRQQQQKTRGKAVQGHVRARGKRVQAKRDARR